jgi:hypothetical protein
MPLLEDHSAIQLVLSQVAQGLFSGTLQPAEARALSYSCQVAACTMPRPVSVRPRPTEQKPASRKPSPKSSPAPTANPAALSRNIADPLL